MSVQTPTVLLAQSTDAAFRAWGKAMSDAFTAVGIPKTSDTGQVDWATVTHPTVANTAMGYEIRQFNDTLQATHPVLIKIEWGSAGGATSPAIWITFGTASDGAGNLTGLVMARKQLTMAGANTTNSTMYVCGDANRLLVMVNIDVGVAANMNFGFGIERTHDSAGADTNEGFLFWTLITAAITQAAFLFGTGVVNQEVALGALLPSVGSGASGSSVALYPIFCSKGVYLNPFLNVLVAFLTNISPGVALSFTYYGATRQFMPVGNPPVGITVRGNVGGTCWLLRNE
jgi:hypothetical protein